MGRVVGIQNCAANLPGIVAPLLTGWLRETTSSYEAPMHLTVGSMMTARLCTNLYTITRSSVVAGKTALRTSAFTYPANH